LAIEKKEISQWIQMTLRLSPFSGFLDSPSEETFQAEKADWKTSFSKTDNLSKMNVTKRDFIIRFDFVKKGSTA